MFSTMLLNRNSPFAKAAGAVFVFFLSLLVSGCIPPTIDANDPLEKLGPYQVGHSNTIIPFEDTDGIEAEVFTPDSEAPFGLVIFLPGFGASYSLYSGYLEHLASHGYVALGMNFPGNAFALDSRHDVKAQQVLAAVTFLRNLHPSYLNLQIAVAGHSMGGKLAFYAAALEPEIDIVMALDPVNAGGPPCFLFPDYCANYPVAPNPNRDEPGILSDIENLASLIMRSAPDPVTNPEAEFNAQWFYYGSDGDGSDAIPSPALYYDFADLPHAGYIPLPPSEATVVIKRTMLAWLNQHMRAEDMQEYLTGARIQADIDAGRLRGIESR